jgi:hypothetical protein
MHQWRDVQPTAWEDIQSTHGVAGARKTAGLSLNFASPEIGPLAS